MANFTAIDEPTKKPWGTTVCLFSSRDLRIARIAVMPGGYCSVHYHKGQVNKFILLSGSLHVEVFDDDNPDGVAAVLNAENPCFTVEPMEIHRFSNRTDQIVEALEIYLPSGIDPISEDDIHRYNNGGIAARK